MRYFDVWQVDTARHTMRSYIEDEHGRLASDMGPWEDIPSDLDDLADRLAIAGFRHVLERHISSVAKWARSHVST